MQRQANHPPPVRMFDSILRLAYPLALFAIAYAVFVTHWMGL